MGPRLGGCRSVSRITEGATATDDHAERPASRPPNLDGSTLSAPSTPRCGDRFAARIGRGTIIAVYRLKETRSGFIEGWLMTDAELRALGFAPVEEFIGVDKWSHFETVRHQYAATRPRAKRVSLNQPGSLHLPYSARRCERQDSRT